MKLSTLKELIETTIKTIGDVNLNSIEAFTPCNNKRGGVFVLDTKRVESSIMIDPVWDNQKGVTLRFSSSAIDRGLSIYEPVMSLWDSPEDTIKEFMAEAPADPAPEMFTCERCNQTAPADQSFVVLIDPDDGHSDAIEICLDCYAEIRGAK